MPGCPASETKCCLFANRVRGHIAMLYLHLSRFLKSVWKRQLGASRPWQKEQAGLSALLRACCALCLPMGSSICTEAVSGVTHSGFVTASGLQLGLRVHLQLIVAVPLLLVWHLQLPCVGSAHAHMFCAVPDQFRCSCRLKRWMGFRGIGLHASSIMQPLIMLGLHFCL